MTHHFRLQSRWRKGVEKGFQNPRKAQTPKLKDQPEMTAGWDGTGGSEWERKRENALDKIYAWRGEGRGETQSRLLYTGRDLAL